MSNDLSNKFRYLLFKGDVTPLSDTFKIILMDSTFVWTPTFNYYADVSAHELPTAYGYTAGGQALAGVSLTEDDTNHKAYLTWSNASWTASGGSIAALGAIIFDDTLASDPLVAWIDFATVQTATDGTDAVVANLKINLV